MKNDSINHLASILEQAAPRNYNLIVDMVKQNPVYDSETKMMITIGQKIVFANKKFCTSLKYECEQLRHTDIMDLIPLEDQDILKVWIERLITRGSIQYMLRGFMGDGEQVWVKITSIYLNRHNISISFFKKVGHIPTSYQSKN